MNKTVIVIVNLFSQQVNVDLEIPLDISANNLIIALNSIFGLNIDTEQIHNCYLKTENPVALLHGSKMLSEYGIHDGTIINITE